MMLRELVGLQYAHVARYSFHAFIIGQIEEDKLTLPKLTFSVLVADILAREVVVNETPTGGLAPSSQPTD